MKAQGTANWRCALVRQYPPHTRPQNAHSGWCAVPSVQSLSRATKIHQPASNPISKKKHQPEERSSCNPNQIPGSHLPPSALRRLGPKSRNRRAATTPLKTREVPVAFEGSSPEDLCKVLIVAQLRTGKLAVFALRLLYATSSALGCICVLIDSVFSITVYVPCVSVCQRSTFSG